MLQQKRGQNDVPLATMWRKLNISFERMSMMNKYTCQKYTYFAINLLLFISQKYILKI